MGRQQPGVAPIESAPPRRQIAWMDPSSRQTQPFAAATRIPSLATDPASVRRRVEAMEHLLEGLVTIPGLRRKLGLDVILDLIPVVGDMVAALMGVWMVWEARNLGMQRFQIARMLCNVGLDFVLGLIPWVGAIPDFLFRSNSRNLKIIKHHLDRHHPGTATVEGRRR